MHSFQTCIEKKAEQGTITRFVSSLIYADGLKHVRIGEVVILENDEKSRVLRVNENEVLLLLLGSPLHVKVGMKVVRTQEKLTITVGDFLLGNSVNSLGNILEVGGTHKGEKREVEVPPLGLAFRSNTTGKLSTGVALVDLLVPLAKGQRELIIGDKKTGKTQFALQTMISQAKEGAVCIYAGISHKPSAFQTAKKLVKEAGVTDRCIFVESLLGENPGSIFITPYTAMTIAEYFRDQGHNVLIILDSMTKHAEYYREIALLAQEFPGKEAYPGDIFFQHSHLIERAGSFSIDGKKTAITCLPIAEITEGDLTGYIQTNLMSMTDGHLFFDNDVFLSGRKPAINLLLSVTRVGRQTQNQLEHSVSNALLELLTEYQKAQGYLRFGAELSESLKTVLERGDRLETTLHQPGFEYIDHSLALTLAGLLWATNWDDTQTEAFKKIYNTNKTMQTTIKKITTQADSLETLTKLLKEHSKTWERLL